MIIDSYRFATAAFNPQTQVAPTHSFWAESFASDPGDGNLVGQWENSNGSSHLTAAGSVRPTMRYAVSAFNGHKAVEFDGTDDSLYFDITDMAIPWKVITVVRYLGSPPAGNVCACSFGSTANGWRRTATSGRLGFHSGTSLNSSDTGDIGNAGHVLRGSAAAGAQEMWVDGTSKGTASVATPDNVTRIRLGSSGNNTSAALWANCQIAFHALYPGATSDTDLATLCADLKTYYGL